MKSAHKSQADRILDAFKAGRWISALDALRDFGCLRLAARVHELRRAGHDIRRVNVQKYNDAKAHVEYYLAAQSCATYHTAKETHRTLACQRTGENQGL